MLSVSQIGERRRRVFLTKLPVDPVRLLVRIGWEPWPVQSPPQAVVRGDAAIQLFAGARQSCCRIASAE